MVKLTNSDKVYRFVMEKNEKIKIRDVYNRIFFSTFGLDDIRIYSKNEELTEQIDNEKNTLSESVSDNFEKENGPSGYNDLPLYKTIFEKDDGTIAEENEVVEENSGIYGFLNDYISKYNKPQEKKDIKQDEVAITIPRDINNPIIALQDFTIPDKESSISKNGITYEILEKITRDIYLQINYLKDNGYFYNEIPLENMFLINGRYIILSIETVDEFNKSAIEPDTQVKDAFLQFLQKLMDDDIKNILEKIQHTELYYFIKRVQDENVFLLLQ